MAKGVLNSETQFELEVWRSVGSHFGFEDAIGPIAQTIGRQLSIDFVTVRRFVPEHLRIDTVAASTVHGDSPVDRPRTNCSSDNMSRVISWCRAGDVCLADPGEDAVVDVLAPPGQRGSTIACPLAIEGQPIGALLMVSRRPRSLDGSHRELATRLVGPVSAALNHQFHLQELARLKESLEADRQALLSRLQRDDIVESLVGSDTGLRVVMQRVEQVAPTDTAVLLLGETGTGKEVVARAIHAASRRERGPMVRVNCGAIPPELVDSELFGHERGSFTGAVAQRKGCFERADGGTLLLDEFGDLPLPAQVRLLRILQDGTLERVGGQQTLTVDVRIVAATNLDLEAMVAAGKFREDLWYRISVFPIRIPALRERPEDIPALAEHFAARAGRRLGRGALAPSEQDIRQLLSYDWPGNVRELASVIERATILGNGRRLEVAAALGVTNGPTTRTKDPLPTEEGGSAASEAAFPTIEKAMARHIEKALIRCRGRIEGEYGAARLLSINPHTLRARMRKLGIDWASFRVPTQLR